MKFITSLTLFLIGSLAFYADAAGNNKAHLVAIGQGISSPTFTSTVNFSSGYTHESPIGTIYQNKWRLTGEYDTSEEENSSGERNSGYGGEFGYGSGTAGIAVGYYTRDCDECDGEVAGSAGVAFGFLAAGLRAEEDQYTAALMFNPNGKHRFGVIAEIDDTNGTGEQIQSYGLGYALVAGNWTFAVDASKRNYENEGTYADRILVTPGLSVRADFIQLSLNDEITLHDREDDSQEEERTHHEFWAGVGIGGDAWHLALYANYVNDFSAALSFMF